MAENFSRLIADSAAVAALLGAQYVCSPLVPATLTAGDARKVVIWFDDPPPERADFPTGLCTRP